MPKKIPSRMCVVCRNMFEKPDLIRVVKGADGVSIDLTGKKAGRGAYVCKNPECFEKCVFDRVFQEKLSDEVYESLKEEYAKLGQNS